MTEAVIPITYIPRSDIPPITLSPSSTPPTTTRYFIDDRLSLPDGPCIYVVYEQDAADLLIGPPLHIAVDAILEYVSPAHLEDFENWRFEHPEQEPPIIKVNGKDIPPKKRKRSPKSRIVTTAPSRVDGESSDEFVHPKKKRSNIVVPVVNGSANKVKKRGKPAGVRKKDLTTKGGQHLALPSRFNSSTSQSPSRAVTPLTRPHQPSSTSLSTSSPPPDSTKRKYSMLQAVAPPPADEYEIERILRHQDIGGMMFYFAKWVGYGEADGTWLSEEELGGAAEVLREYKRSGAWVGS
ncbi:hypothetical protein P152DRAFT_470930 [Eremomyces bilateralis CBS 781.70]|uniref:Chromo domain-containing protein n=1 Tax=Eremomyces bilateralis CBS 781.70 TaxID=1392243 RepID=A0A6G1GBN0_9PEZI|nr:uncharacterized protein P152DRAFT_470930 [Eremomyces bilateralis CBS 781.70]KAF1815497.1 hypothetical protein P152DRAFT_470930 [Eremomyces bilateralis CBS 781.70]